MRKKPIAILCMAFFSGQIYSPSACAENYFDPNLLKSFDGAPEIKTVDKAITQKLAEGHYHLHVSLNDDKTYRVMPVTLTQRDGGDLQPCFSSDDYRALGVDFTASGVHIPDSPEVTTCIPLSEAIPDATYQLDSSHMALKIIFPQFVLAEGTDDYIPPSLWDEGVSALLFEYQYSGSETAENSSSSSGGTENFLNLNSGINLGAWRLRNNSTWENQADSGQQWENISTYVERTIPRFKSEFFAGDTYTSAETFDSVKLRGMQLATDTNMLPESTNGFAPVIHGIARSNATVFVREHNNVIYQTNVPPGPFTINNLTPVSTGGTLDITIKESDGTETHFQQNYATVSTLQRQGAFKYAFAIGRYQADDSISEERTTTISDKEPDTSATEIKSKDANIIQFNSAWGIPYNLTLLDGIQIAENDYIAENIGVGADLGSIGAISSDITHSHSRDFGHNEPSRSGESYRFIYSKHIDLTDTDIQSSIRHYSKKYLSLADGMEFDKHRKQKKYEYTTSINQMVMDSQSLFLSASNNTYYDGEASNSYQAGWSTAISSAQVSLSLSMSKNDDTDQNAEWDKQIAVTVSLPLSIFSGNNSGSLSTTMNSDMKGSNSIQSGYSNSALENHQLNYSVQMGRDFNHSGDDNSRSNIDLDWSGRVGDSKLGYAHESTQDKVTWGLDGGIIFHAHGVTFGKYSSGATAVVSAPGLANIPLTGAPGLKTNPWGYALIPDISAYSRNTIEFDTTQNADFTDMDSVSQTVIPTRDAVVLAHFNTHPGEKMIATLYRGVTVIPFGAKVTVSGTDRTFFVGNDGQIYLNGIPTQGVMTITYGDDQTCHTQYDTHNGKYYHQFSIIKLHCHD